MTLQDTPPPILGPERPDAAPLPRDEVTLAVQRAAAPAPTEPTEPTGDSTPWTAEADQAEAGQALETTANSAEAAPEALPIPAGAMEGEPADSTLLGLPVRREDVLPGLLTATGVGILVVVLLRRLRTRSRARPASEEPYERIKQLHADAHDRGKSDAAMADAEELARRLAALMDNKAARIEVLLQQAEERIEALTAAGAEQRRPATNGREQRDPLEPSGSASGSSANGFKPTSHERVYELADAGRDAVSIAQELGQPIGEVELILALRS